MRTPLDAGQFPCSRDSAAPQQGVNESYHVAAAHRSPLMLSGLQRALESDGSFRFSGSRACLSEIGELLARRPDVLLIEYEQAVAGHRWTSALKQDPFVRLVLFGGSGDVGNVQLALNLGAVGLVHHNIAVESLLRGLLDVAQGRSFFYLEPNAAPARSAARSSRSSGLDMTKREEQVLQLLMLRMTNYEISRRLNLTRQTVKNYVSQVYRKLGVSGRDDLMRLDTSMMIEGSQAPSSVDALACPSA